MSDNPTIPAPQYTLHEAIAVCLAMCERALAEIRALARLPGPRGEPGPEGKRGPAGEKGERGVKGDAGRNASDLVLLQEHIEQRVERAIDAIAVTTSDGGRTLRLTFGDKVREVKTALVLDAGVWKEGKTYLAGDAVTQRGSLFIAQATTTAKPGDSNDWRLAVQRGKDGNNYRPDEKRTPEPVRFK